MKNIIAHKTESHSYNVAAHFVDVDLLGGAGQRIMEGLQVGIGEMVGNSGKNIGYKSGKKSHHQKFYHFSSGLIRFPGIKGEEFCECEANNKGDQIRWPDGLLEGKVKPILN